MFLILHICLVVFGCLSEMFVKGFRNITMGIKLPSLPVSVLYPILHLFYLLNCF